MRFFIAIDLENEDYFRDIQKQLDTENAKLNLTKTYHLTLKFLGEVEDSKVNKIKEALQKVRFETSEIATRNLPASARIKRAISECAQEHAKGFSPAVLDSFKIKTTKIGVFPNFNFVRVIWVGLEPEDKIIEIKNKVDDCLSNIFSREKEFTPHLTLARVKFVKDKSKFAENLEKIRFESKEFEVKNIKLIKSTLLPDGPVYETIN